MNFYYLYLFSKLVFNSSRKRKATEDEETYQQPPQLEEENEDSISTYANNNNKKAKNALVPPPRNPRANAKQSCAQTPKQTRNNVSSTPDTPPEDEEELPYTTHMSKTTGKEYYKFKDGSGSTWTKPGGDTLQTQQTHATTAGAVDCASTQTVVSKEGVKITLSIVNHGPVISISTA